MSETQNIEWKESWRDEYFKWVCGYANAQGGKLFIGVDDNGVLLGIGNARELLEKLPNQVRQFLGILVDVNLLEEDDNEYLEIVVEAYPYPISYRGNISVYEDKIMFWNDGQLPENWTIDKLFKKHPSQPYNPDIANAFFRAGLIESWGRGVDVMVQACSEYGSPAPVLRYEDSGFWVEFLARKSKKPVQESSVKSSVKILDQMRVDPYVSAKAIAGRLGLSLRAVEKQIARLKEDGKLERIGAAKGGFWRVIERDGRSRDEPS